VEELIGNRIKILRNQKGISQGELAKIVGKTQQAVNLWEKGVNEPSLDIINLLADYFNVSADYLLGRTTFMHPSPITEAASRTDNPLDDLPEDARRSLEEFQEFMWKKYRKDR
jgi:transcriptional regulator with XRE-family HTH domain